MGRPTTRLRLVAQLPATLGPAVKVTGGVGVPDRPMLTDWTLAWARLRPWAMRLLVGVFAAAGVTVAATGIWLSVWYRAGREPGTEDYVAPGRGWAHQWHVRSGAVMLIAVGLAVVVLLLEHVRRRRPPALRVIGVTILVSVGVIVAERSGAGLRWVGYSIDGHDVTRVDDGGERRAFTEAGEIHGAPWQGIWSVIVDDRVDSVTALRHDAPFATDTTSGSTFRRRALGHLLVGPAVAGAVAILVLATRRGASARAPVREGHHRRPTGGGA